jgi:hypothetical protein
VPEAKFSVAGNVVLVIGAGFSKPFGGPLLSELLDDAVCVNSRAEPDAIETLRACLVPRTASGVAGPLTVTPTLEDVFSALWRERHTADLTTIKDSVWTARELADQLVLHLGSICAKVRFDQRRWFAPLYRKFLKRLYTNARSLTIVSFNYDALVEDILENIGLRYSYGTEKAVRFADGIVRGSLKRFGADVMVFKPHGSVNWGICRGCNKATPGMDLINVVPGVYVPPNRASCSFCGKPHMETAIVPPVLEKGPDLRPFEEIWKGARRALRRSKEVIVVGYSCPQTDGPAISMLREVVGQFKRPRIRVICGPKGAPATYETIYPHFTDEKAYFEQFLDTKFGG